MIDFDELVNSPAIAAFGQVVTILPQYGARYDINAIFRRSSDDDLIDPGVVSSSAYLSCRTSEVGGLTYEDLIQVDGETFAVGSIIPEDKGMTRVNLRDHD